MSGGRLKRLESLYVRWRQLEVMTLKEILQLGRDWVLLIYIVYIFTIQIMIAAGESSSELHKAAMYVYDGDHSTASRELIHRFHPPYFEFSGEVFSPHEALEKLDMGEATMLLDIPPDFEGILNRNASPATAQLLVDTSKANTGYLASIYTARIGAEFSRSWAEKNLIRSGMDPRFLPEIQNRQRIWYNMELDERWFGTISELLTMITVACLLLPAAAMVREKERGTIEQLLVSPLSPFQVMFSKVMSMILVTLVGTAVSLFLVMQPLYGVPFRGSLILFFTLTALYAFTNAGLGLVLATFARNSGQAGMLVLLTVMPIIMLSGTRTPLESMPTWLAYLINISPMRHFIEIGYGILLRGAGLDVLWDSLLAMTLLGALLFALGLHRFRRQFE